jgi:hypothetical protein
LNLYKVIAKRMFNKQRKERHAQDDHVPKAV